MSQSDPIVFAAKAAALPEAILLAELKRLDTEPEGVVWRQAVEDELALRGHRPIPL